MYSELCAFLVSLSQFHVNVEFMGIFSSLRFQTISLLIDDETVTVHSPLCITDGAAGFSGHEVNPSDPNLCYVPYC